MFLIAQKNVSPIPNSIGGVFETDIGSMVEPSCLCDTLYYRISYPLTSKLSLQDVLHHVALYVNDQKVVLHDYEALVFLGYKITREEDADQDKITYKIVIPLHLPVSLSIGKVCFQMRLNPLLSANFAAQTIFCDYKPLHGDHTHFITRTVHKIRLHDNDYNGGLSFDWQTTPTSGFKLYVPEHLRVKQIQDPENHVFSLDDWVAQDKGWMVYHTQYHPQDSLVYPSEKRLLRWSFLSSENKDAAPRCCYMVEEKSIDLKPQQLQNNQPTTSLFTVTGSFLRNDEEEEENDEGESELDIGMWGWLFWIGLFFVIYTILHWIMPSITKSITQSITQSTTPKSMISRSSCFYIPISSST